MILVWTYLILSFEEKKQKEEPVFLSGIYVKYGLDPAVTV